MRSEAIIGAVQGVTKKWAKQRKKEERDAAAQLNRRRAMTNNSRNRCSIRAAAWHIMEAAYLKASANGKLPALARQVMYAARPYIQRTANRELGKDFDQYFTQTLLPDYMEEHGCQWNVVFDARGNFHEPHTKKTVPLGTLQVREYLARTNGHQVEDLDFYIWEARYPTIGPANRYGAILFVEKEGFMPLFKAVNLAERYDLAIMSTKGMSVTASRQLVDTICAAHDVPLLVLHDFDKAGFSIVGTLKRDTRRYTFSNAIQVIDLGMRLEDIDGLETEAVHIPRTSRRAACKNLLKNGANEQEIEFLVEKRVELNAFASDALIAWLEAKLQQQGVVKITPDEHCLTHAYRRAIQQALVQEQIDEIMDEARKRGESASIPKDLRSVIQSRLRARSTTTWDSVVQEIAQRDVDDWSKQP